MRSSLFLRARVYTSLYNYLYCINAVVDIKCIALLYNGFSVSLTNDGGDDNEFDAISTVYCVCCRSAMSLARAGGPLVRL